MPNPAKGRTLDRGPPGGRAPHTVGVIGPKRKLLPDGSLLCEDVPIARTGTMMYRPGEVPLKPPTRAGAAQVLYVTRDAATLFAPHTLGSAIGAAITLDHPPVDVTPHNWSQLAQGFVLDAWQGDGDEAELMFADLIIKNKGAIHKVNTEGIREVSLGYDANYEQTGDGEGRQDNIIINHLALVERGRCGPRCAIGDRHTGEAHMGREANNGGPRPRVRLDEVTQAVTAALQNLGDEGNNGDDDDDGVHVHLHMGGERTTDASGEGGGGDRTTDTLEARVGDIEAGMTEMNGTLQAILARLPGGDGGNPPPNDNNAATGDSGALQASFQQFLSQAEILVPGYKAPTFDSALPRAKTVDTMCAGRRAVLTLLAATKDGEALLRNVTDDGFEIDKADCTGIATAFKAAAAVKATTNNRSATGDKLGLPTQLPPAVNTASGGGMKRVTDAEINAANAKYWAQA